MHRYSGYGSAATGSSKTILALTSATTVRPAIYDLNIGCAAAPADIAGRFVLQRLTALGTEGSGFTPVALDPADVAARADYGVGAYSVEPTYTASAILLSVSLNQRATYRWVCNEGRELIAPATANNGIGCQSTAMSSGTTAFEVTMWHKE